MNKRTKTILIWALLPVVICAVMFGTELILQRRVLTLPEAQRGLIFLPLTGENAIVSAAPSEEHDDEAYDEEYDEGFEEDFDEAAFDEEYDEAYNEDFDESYDEADGEPVPEDGRLVLAPGDSLTLRYEGYAAALTFTGTATTDTTYILSWETAAGASQAAHDFFTAIEQDTSRVDADVSALTLTFPEGATLTGVTVDNRFLLNPNRMLLTGLIAAALYLLAAFRRRIGEHAELGFLIVALMVGLYASIGLPTNVNLSFDDQTHFERVQTLSQGRHAISTAAPFRMSNLSFCVAREDGSFLHPVDTLQDECAFNALLDEIDQDREVYGEQTVQFRFSDVGYLTQAAGYALARGLGMPFRWQLIAARLANMLTYVLLCYVGIRTMKRFKLLLSAVALMPTPLYLCCNFSYDPTISGLCFLGTALVMDAVMDRRSLLSWRRGLGIMLCLTLGALTKTVYIPLLLLTLMLPREKFASSAARRWYKGFAVLICLMTLSTMLLSIATGGTALEDPRGTGADSAGQISYILHHPLTYAGTLIAYLWNNFTVYFISACRETLAYAGALPPTVSTLLLILLFAAVFTDHPADLDQRLSARQRLWGALVLAATVALTFTTMYVAFTGVGLTTFDGVQGRYMIPVLPLMWMLLAPDQVENHAAPARWNTGFFTLEAALLAVMCQASLLGQFFL